MEWTRKAMLAPLLHLHMPYATPPLVCDSEKILLLTGGGKGLTVTRRCLRLLLLLRVTVTVADIY